MLLWEERWKWFSGTMLDRAFFYIHKAQAVRIKINRLKKHGRPSRGRIRFLEKKHQKYFRKADKLFLTHIDLFKKLYGESEALWSTFRGHDDCCAELVSTILP